MKKTLLLVLLFGLLFQNNLRAQTNSALTFSTSTSTYVRVPYSSVLQSQSAITVEAWLNVNTWAYTPGIVGNTEVGGYEFNIGQVGGIMQLHFIVNRNGNNADVYFSQSDFGTGWHHVAGTYDGQYSKIYLDGVLKATNDAGAIYPIQYSYNNSLIIGAEASSGADAFGNYFNGSIDEVRIWNYTRKVDSIQAAMSRQLVGTEPGLIGYWKFDEGVGTTVSDATANNNDGTLVNSPTWILFDGGKSWYTLGTAGISDGLVYHVNLAIASDGTPYVGYIDNANGNKVTVMKYDGSSWVAVGTKGFSASSAMYLCMTMASNGTLYVAYQDGANSNKVTVQKFNGTNWVVVGAAGFSAGSATDIQIAVNSSGTPYVGFADGANSGKPTAMYFDGSFWNILGTAGVTPLSPGDQDFCLSNDGVPHFALRYLNGKASVMNFVDSRTPKWDYVGSPSFSSSTAYFIKIAFSPSNVPYVVYVDSRVTVMKDSSNWWVPVGSNISKAGGASQSYLAFASDGTPYVTYTESGYMVVKKYDGTSWQFVGTATITNTSTDYPVVAINSNGIPYEAHTEAGLNSKVTMRRYLLNSETTPLPVELTSFTVSFISSYVELKWRTVTEVNNYGFEIERASFISNEVRNLNWQKVGFVQGHGNSNSTKEYSFTDNLSLDPALNLSYRLKQIDNDGTFKYSEEVEVKTQLPLKFLLSQNYPNPFNPNTTIRYQLPQNSFVTLKVFDVLGKEVSVLVNEVEDAGNHEVNFDASKLASGIYFCKMQTEDFTGIKKLLLIK